MRSTQVTTWRRYTAAEKKAYRARQRRRAQRVVWINGMGVLVDRFQLQNGTLSIATGPVQRISDALVEATEAARESVRVNQHFFADNLGSRVPTQRVNGGYL